MATCCRLVSLSVLNLACNQTLYSPASITATAKAHYWEEYYEPGPSSSVLAMFLFPLKPSWWAFSKCCGHSHLKNIYISIIYTAFHQSPFTCSALVPTVPHHCPPSTHPRPHKWDRKNLATIQNVRTRANAYQMMNGNGFIIYSFCTTHPFQNLNPHTFYYSMVLFKSMSISVLFKPWGDMERTHPNGWNNTGTASVATTWNIQSKWLSVWTTLEQEERVGNAIRNVQIFSQERIRGFGDSDQPNAIRIHSQRSDVVAVWGWMVVKL